VPKYRCFVVSLGKTVFDGVRDGHSQDEEKCRKNNVGKTQKIFTLCRMTEPVRKRGGKVVYKNHEKHGKGSE
jgi:hypothetical protein